MSQSNEDLVRRGYALFAEGDLEAVLTQFFHSDVEFRDVAEMPGAEVYRGHSGVRRAYQRWMEAWDDFRFWPEEVIDLEDGRVWISTRIGGRGKRSSMPLDVQIYEIYTLREGRAVKREAWFEERAAREAAGLDAGARSSG